NFTPCTFMCSTSISRNNGLISRAKETSGITFSFRQGTQNPKFVNMTLEEIGPKRARRLIFSTALTVPSHPCAPRTRPAAWRVRPFHDRLSKIAVLIQRKTRSDQDKPKSCKE